MNSGSHPIKPENRKRISFFWPERILGPCPSLKELNLICWGLFVAFLLAPLGVIHWTQVKHGGGSIRQLHSDFVYFYGDGEIAREYPAVKIYDYPLQKKVFTAIYPAYEGVYGPSPYPPFVALFFALFTHLSFESAYRLWFGISLTFYLLGIASACAAAFPGGRLKISLILCSALAFYPFLFDTLLNGQLCSVAICSTGLAVYQEKRGNLFLSGLALALLAYKPTLLLLVLPMLLLTRRFRTLLGFAAGTGFLTLAATAFAGVPIWSAYAHMLRNFGRVIGLGTASHLRLWQYVDLYSCFAAIPGGRSGYGLTALASIFCAIAIALVWLLWKSASSPRPVQWFAWAATLTWTLLLNIYAPIYDSVLVVLAIILTLGALRELGWTSETEWTTLLAVAVFAVSWVTESFAQSHRIQLLTVLLTVLGSWQLALLHRAIRAKSPEIAARKV